MRELLFYTYHMSILTKKLQSGFEIPVFGLGTWQMGGREERNPDNDDARDIEAIQQALHAGITHIDTAEMYAGGHTEVLVGEAIKGFDRTKLFLTSKVLKGNQKEDGVYKAVESSLKRLGSDYLDLYLIHAPDQSVHIRETMKAMNRIVTQGLVKHIGVSNFSLKQFEMAQHHSSEKLVTNQLHYNLEVREIEHNGNLKYYHDHDVIVTAWRPLQKSMILQEGKEILEEVGRNYGKTPAQVAINWLISQKNVVTMSTMRDEAHLKENLGAVDWNLTEEDIDHLRSSFPHQKTESDVFPLPDWIWE